jgi:hypothetical protein
LTEIQSKLISIIIFSAVILTSIFSFNQVLFPKLLIELTSVYQNESDNIFELGIWGIPFLISNITFGLIWFSIKFFKIPIRKYIQSVLDFDLSKKITILILIIIFSIYLTFAINGLDDFVSNAGDYADTLEGVENVSLYAETEDGSQGHLNYFYLRYVFLNISYTIFNSIEVLPFLSSVALLSLTYLLSVKLSGKRISGIVAVIIVIQSNLFHIFDTQGSYDTFWITFFLLALYLILLKKPYISPISFIVAILTKLVAFLFFPIFISLILSTNESIRKKKKILLLYCFFPIFFIVGFFIPGAFSIEQFGTIDTRSIVTSFSVLAIALRYDGLILLSFFPILFLLMIKSRNNFRYANFLLVSITTILVIPPLISGVAGYTNEPYRFVSLLPLFAISVGYLFTKKINPV